MFVRERLNVSPLKDFPNYTKCKFCIIGRRIKNRNIKRTDNLIKIHKDLFRKGFFR